MPGMGPREAKPVESPVHHRTMHYEMLRRGFAEATTNAWSRATLRKR